MSTGDLTYVKNPGEVVDAVGLGAEHLGVVEGQPPRGPAVLQPSPGDVNRNAIPALLSCDVEVQYVIEDGDQHFAAHDRKFPLITTKTTKGTSVNTHIILPVFGAKARQPSHQMNHP